MIKNSNFGCAQFEPQAFVPHQRTRTTKVVHGESWAVEKVAMINSENVELIGQCDVSLTHFSSLCGLN